MSDLIEISLDWSSASWPSLDGVTAFAADTETTGLKQEDRAVSASFAFQDLPSLWFAWGHETGNNCGIHEFKIWAERELAKVPLKIWHNAQFDYRMLYAAGVDLPLTGIEDTGIIAPLLDERVPSFGLDSLSRMYLREGKHDDGPLNEWCAAHFKGRAAMKNQVRNYHRAPGYRVAPYGVKDAELTFRLYHAMRPKIDEVTKDEPNSLARVYDVETRLIPIMIMMNRVGFRASVEKANTLSDDIIAMVEDKQKEWALVAPGVNVNSSPQLGKFLMDQGLSLPMTATGKPSCTADVLKGLQHHLASLALDIRKLDKFKDTFVRNYILRNVNEQGLIHGQFHQLKKEDQRGASTGTVSGRFSSSGGLNLQNLPSTDPDNAHTLKHQLSERVRGCFVPYYDGGRILSVDYSQIEFRIIAHYAGGKLRQEYNDDPTVDFHKMVAKITGIDRKPAKNINFGLAYGMGIRLMAERLGVSFEVAQGMLNVYHGKMPEVKMIYNAAMRKASRRGYIRTLLDRRRRFFEDPERRYGPYAHTHKALNALAQGGGADIMKLAMVMMCEEGLIDWKERVLHATVHDEIVATTPEGDDEIVAAIKDCMERTGVVLGLTVPIIAEAKVGPSWGTATKWRIPDVSADGSGGGGGQAAAEDDKAAIESLADQLTLDSIEL